MENFEEKACLCALNRVFGFEPKTGLALISHFGSAREIFSLNDNELEHILGPYSKYRGKVSPGLLHNAEEELMSLSAQGITFHGITEPSYPPLLKECEDAPIGIYVKSSTPASMLWKEPSVSVVGTRDISPYGKEWCGKIVRGLAGTVQKPVIISGLALGVDIEAHRSALEAGLPTIAVMATGPDGIYPYRHREFAEKIVSTPGCALVTDYPPGTAPLAIHFLRRNRIIAGLSGSTLLIESRIKGGGMMTCRLAFSYNREVYALPGRADDLRSMGCNELIRRKIAEPVTSVSSFIESLGMKASARGGAKESVIERIFTHYRGSLQEDEIRSMASLMETVSQERGITVEELAQKTGIPYIRASQLAGILEIDGFLGIDLLQRCSINPKNM